ncbi:MAG: 4Fe-4S binding protein [Planctomycetaceae bacterium]|nr:4Fe-4S binding protein [Planctomycetaceae bacterium]
MKCESRKGRGSGDGAVSLSLPVVPAAAGGGRPRGAGDGADGHDGQDGHAPKGSLTPHSRMGWRRAIVLGVIQILMIVHVVQWLWTGSTVSPLEPSESMETVKDGVINAGTVLFAVLLLSTALLGRWFCGWGCHVVMLQDFCGYLMKKVGIRPKLFRSRLLLWLPLCLAVYMFLWPLAYRFGIAPFTRPELTWPGFTTEFTTTDFWATFPGVLMGMPFLLVCGFLAVYLLGAKGYCTYGCPYGGFFAPLDEVSPVRIRVTDACSGCGHCTAVCTSNVRIHEEVRDYRMVVDQGCMKCLDCVSACPENALFVGIGKPAFLAKTDAPRKERRWDLTWNEEIAFGLVAVLSFFAVRGPIGVPLLFASGIAISVTALAWFAYRALSGRDARLHRLELRRGGRIRAAGAAMVAVAAISLGGVGYVGALNGAMALGDFQNSRVRMPPEVVFSGTRMQPDAAMVEAAQRARRFYTFALPAPEGWGFRGPWTRALESNIVWLSSVTLDYDRAEAILRDRIEREGPNEFDAAALARVMRGDGRLPDALAFSRAEWERNPEWEGLREELVDWLLDEGRRDEALAIARSAVAKRTDDLNAMRRLSLILAESADPREVEEGLALIDRTLVIAPDNAFAHRARAAALRGLGRIDEAQADYLRAIELAPEQWRFQQELGEMLMSADRLKEAGPFLKRAGEMRVKELDGR